MSALRRHLSAQASALAQRLTLLHPAPGLRLAGLHGNLAALRATTGRTPTVDEVQELLGPLDAAAIQHIRSAIARLYFQNEALLQVARSRGRDPLVPLVRSVHAEPLLRLRRDNIPIIVTGWHQGPKRAASLALRRLGIPTLFAIRDAALEQTEADDSVRYMHMRDEVDEARFLKRAHRELADGVVIGLHLDWLWTAGETVSVLGRRIQVGRGPAVLARLAGARLVPVTRRFVGSSGYIDVTFHDAIPDADLDRGSGAAFDCALLGRAAAWFDTYLRHNPEELRAERFNWLLDAPPDGAGADATERTARWRRRLSAQRRTHQRANWERRWADPAFDDRWQGRGVSPEIKEADASGWFPSGGRALDAGCGKGEVTAWLATRGYSTLGVDIAEAAVAYCRATYGEQPNALQFARLDLCEHAPDGGPFHIVVDRGCFLQIPADDRAAYAARLAAACTDDARVLIFGRAFRDGIAFGDAEEIDRRRQELMDPFGPYFELERMTMTYMDRYRGERPDQQLPGLVWWLRRRPS